MIPTPPDAIALLSRASVAEVEAIAPPLFQPRRAAIPGEQQDAFIASIRAQGLLQPLIVAEHGNTLRLVDGTRRLEAARALGLREVPVRVLEGCTEAEEAAASVAANMARLALAPVDQWRAIVALQARGHTLADAAARVGISEHLGRRLDKLGRLHPGVLELVEQCGMPEARHLATIAAAPHDMQAAALKAPGAVQRERKLVAGCDWWRIAEACRMQRVPRARAIFDVATAGVAFEEDLFAEPGSEWQFVTTDVGGFLAAQRAALRAEAAASKGRKELLEGDNLPKGWAATWGDADKPKRHEKVYLAVITAGIRIGDVRRVTAEMAAERKAREKAKAAPTHTPAADDATPAEPAAPEPTGITKHGLQLIADAKTQALRVALADPAGPHTAEMLLLCAVLAFHASNVSVRGSRFRPSGAHNPAALVSPEGLLDLDEDAIIAAAADTLAAILGVDGPETAGSSYTCRSGRVAEWIGRALLAERYLPRFDTAEFLATCSAAVLKQAAIEAGLNPAKKAGELRAQLTGHAPDWRPTAAHFGAPGPQPPDDDDEDDQQEDEGDEE